MRRTLAFSAIVTVAFLVAPGCGTTGSARFDFPASVGGIERDVSKPYAFTNTLGWNVTLTEAKMTLGPVYLNTIPALRTSSRWFGLNTAHATGEESLGSGRYVGQVLEQISFDCLSPTLVPFVTPGNMTEESVRTGEVWLYPEPGVDPSAVDIKTEALRVRGTASKGTAFIVFRGTLVLNGDWIPDVPPGDRGAVSVTSIRQVRGIEIAFHPGEGGHLEVRVDASAFFRGADFSALAKNPTDPDGTTILVPQDVVMKNMYAGLHAAKGTYAFAWR